MAASGALIIFAFVALVVADNIGQHILNGLGGSWTNGVTFTTTITTTSTLIENTTTSFSRPSSTIAATLISSTSVPATEGNTINLSHQRINKSVGGDDIDGHFDISLRCLNCSTYGTIDLTASGFNSSGNLTSEFSSLGRNVTNDLQGLRLWNLTSAEEDIERDIDILRSGTFRAEAHGMGAYVEAELDAVKLNHEFSLANMSLPLGFYVPTAGRVGASLKLSLAVTLEVDDPINVAFGFDLSVPDGSYIDFMFGREDNFETQGFSPDEGLQIRPLHMRSNATGPDVTLSVALKTKLVFGYTYLGHSRVASDLGTYADAGIFLELPSFSFTDEPVPDVNTSCRPLFAHTIGDDRMLVSWLGLYFGIESETDFTGLKHILDKTKVLESATWTPSTCGPDHSSTAVGLVSGNAYASPTAANWPPSLSRGYANATGGVATGSGAIASASTGILSFPTGASAPSSPATPLYSVGTIAAAVGRDAAPWLLLPLLFCVFML